MKKVLLLFLIFSLMLKATPGEGQSLGDWKPVGGIAYTNVAFADQQKGIACGGFVESGTTLRTTDGGESWRKIQLDNTNYPIQSVKFTDSRHGWAADLANIFRTTNAGETWQSVVNDFGWLNSYSFLDSLTAFVGSYDTSIVIKTTNGGISWDTLNFPVSGIIRIDDLHFFDLMNGWANVSIWPGGNYILRTSDGGNTWASIFSFGSFIYNFGWMHFTDSQNGWTNYVHTDGDTSNNSLKRTTDGGSTWTTSPILDTGNVGYLHRIQFMNPDTAFLLSDTKMYRTTNGGAQWETFHDFSGLGFLNGHGLKDFTFVDNQTGLIAGTGNLILKTTNGGTSWNEISRMPWDNGFSIWPVDSLTVFTSGARGLIAKSTDGGSIWTTTSTTTTGVLRGIKFFNPSTGWAVGDSGTIFKTTNGGTSWLAKPSGTVQNLQKIELISQHLGWIAGDSGTLLKTTDAGETWHTQAIPSMVQFSVIQFLDSLTGWVAGGGGAVFRTTNGGQTWQNKSLGQNPDISSIFFLDKQNGWAVGNVSVKVWKTTNGGDSWLEILGGNPFGSPSPAIRFSDPQNGWIVNMIYSTYRTTDGGWTWKREIFGPDPSHPLTSLEMTPGKAWASGGKNFTAIIMVRSIPQSSNHHGMVSQVSGRVETNTTGNCLPNPNETPLYNQLVKAEPGSYYTNSATDGSYHLSVPVDTLQPTQYTLSVKPSRSNFYSTPVCPPGNSFPITVSTQPANLIGPDFGIKQPDCHNLNIQVSSWILRPCRRNDFKVFYHNHGTQPAPNAYLLIEFPHWIRPISASRPVVSINDSTWRINIGTVQSGESGVLEIIDSVVCGHPEIMGINQCRKVSIFPTPDCPPPPGWSGASLNTTGVCNQGLVRFSIFNEGTADMTDSVDYVVMLNQFQAKAGRVKLSMADSLHLLVNAQGMEATLLVNQVGMHPLSAFLRTTITGCSDTTYHLVGIPDYYPQPQTPVVKWHCQTIRNSWNPNEKQVFPTGLTPRHVVKPGTRLEYRIRFQNTGNDTAFYAMVLDSLDRNLDPESFELGAVSHTHQFELRTDANGRTYLKWEFAHINLPDSNTHEMGSHGFIQFSISPKAGIVPGTVVTNQAWIFFDQNPPVLTNPTLTTFDNLVILNPSLTGNLFFVPTITTLPESEVTQTTAVSGGLISSDGGLPVTIRGVVWSTEPKPTIAMSTKTMDGTGTGLFGSNLTNLEPSATYYFRAYATNAVGTSYGNERQLTTPTSTLATFSNLLLTEVGHNNATTIRRISSDGGSPVTARGVVWDTSPLPTIALPTKTADGADTGTFVSNLTGLLPVTSYFVRAYATNAVGTAYSEEQQFTTLFNSVYGELPGKTLTVLPNPFSTRVMLRTASQEEISIILCDVFGKELLLQKFQGSTELSLEHLPTGIYFLKLRDQNRIIKLVKQE